MGTRWMIWAAFASLLLDQASKYLVIHWMQLWRVHSIDVLPPLLNFRYGENTGINFGLFANSSDVMRWILIGLAVVICVAVTIWIRGWHPQRWMQISAGLVIGGALGNVLDRLVFGYVQDFLNMSCCGFTNPTSFNVADIFIFAGAAGLIFFENRDKKAA
ncbi:MAG: signal peptidase II [Rhodobacteraceae bacterium]|nr:MAG: signal peptidase II [Paracoccaceae bacterium]